MIRFNIETYTKDEKDLAMTGFKVLVDDIIQICGVVDGKACANCQIKNFCNDMFLAVNALNIAINNEKEDKNEGTNNS